MLRLKLKFYIYTMFSEALMLTFTPCLCLHLPFFFTYLSLHLSRIFTLVNILCLYYKPGTPILTTLNIYIYILFFKICLLCCWSQQNQGLLYCFCWNSIKNNKTIHYILYYIHDKHVKLRLECICLNILQKMYMKNVSRVPRERFQ